MALRNREDKTMKKEYARPEVKVVLFSDVIVTSGETPDDDNIYTGKI